MKNTLQRLLALLIMAAVCTSCSQNQTRNNAEFAAYIANHSSGLLHGDAPVFVSLTGKLKHETPPGSEITSKVMHIVPEIPGKVFVVDDHTIKFLPDGRWPYDTKVRVSVFLNLLTEVPEDFHIFRFELQSLPLSFEVHHPALEVQSDASPGLYRLKGTITLSDKVDLNQADRLLRLSLDNRRIPVRVMAGTDDMHLVYEADSIARKQHAARLELSWDGGAIGSNIRGEMAFELPASGVFTLMNTVVETFPENAVKLWFSDVLDQQQLAEGLVELLPEQAARIEKHGNSLAVYPLDEITGEFELRIAAGLKNSAGIALQNDIVRQVYFGQLKPMVRFTGKSTVLAGNNKGMVSFEAIGLKAVNVQVIQIFDNNVLQFLQWNKLDGDNDLKRVGRIIAQERMELSNDQPSKRQQWASYGISLNRLIASQPGAIYRVILSFQKADAELDCNEDGAAPAPPKNGLGRDVLALWDGDVYYDPSYYIPEDYDWSMRDDPCSNSYYYYEHFAARNILSSNLGLMAIESNKADKELLFVANHLETANPAPQVKIELYDYQQQALASGLTDADGMLRLRWTDIRPWFAIARMGEDVAYLKLDEGAALSYTRFDVGGQATQEGMNAFLFTERGVYRPGDSIHMGIILRTAGEILPDNYPVTLELFNARNQAVAQQAIQLTSDGLGKWSLPTAPEAPTGLWTAIVKAGGASFTKRLRVETVKPNRLKIKYDFGNPVIYNADRNRNATIAVKWLHGAAAPALDVSLERNLKAVPVSFAAWKNYVFDDPSIFNSQPEKTVVPGKLDQNGIWQTTLQLPEKPEVRGMLKVLWTAYVTEPGGDFSVSSHEAVYMPFEHYLGIAAPEPSSEGYLLTGEAQQFNLLRVDAKGNPSGNMQLQAEVFKLDWSWWWSASGHQEAEYISTYNAQKMITTAVRLKDGKGLFSWTPTRDQWGNFLIRLTDPAGGHSTAVVCYVDWPSGYARSGREASGAAAILSLSTDKDQYRSGDKAILSFQGPANGKALVSIERSGRQLDAWWVNTTAGENSVSIPLSTVYSPNVYAHITLLQPVGQLQNDMPIRSYGVANLVVNDVGSRLHPEVILPKEAVASKVFELKVAEKNNLPMTYFLAVVDEGLLDLTGHATPDPHGWFYAKEALDLQTWDMYDFVLGAWGGRMEQTLSVGGDLSLPDREKARQSRFKPMVRFIGPIQLQAGATRTHTFNTDQYIGSVRVMLVAASGRAFGNFSASLAVKQPLMVLATLPRLMHQTDEVVMPVTIFSALKGQHEVEVTASVDGEAALMDGGIQKIKFDGEGEKTVRFGIKAGNQNGLANIKVSAVSGGATASQQLKLSVENPNQRVWNLESHFVEKGKKLVASPVLPGERSTQLLQLEVSAMPSANFEGRLAQLMEFPYGCTEQLTSQAFAQMNMISVKSLNAAQLSDVKGKINSAIRQILQRQTPSGAFGYWPGGKYVNDWADVYATHFLILAARNNFDVPSSALAGALKNQRKSASVWRYDELDGALMNQELQAYRLYVLSVSGAPLMNAMNRLREAPKLTQQAANLLASSYALSGQMPVARQLVLGTNKHQSQEINNDQDFASDVRHNALKAITLMHLNEHRLAFPIISELSAALSSGRWLSTQSTAFALLAWQTYAASFGVSGTKSMKITAEKTTEVTLDKIAWSAAFNPSKLPITVENTGELPLFVTLSASGVEPAGSNRAKQKGVKLSSRFTGDDGRSIDPASIRQGTMFNLTTEVVNLTGSKLSFLALSQIIPAGWEILNERLTGDLEADHGTPDFQDIRDDRVIHHFDLPAGSSRSFSLRLMATYQGTYIFPPQRCEAMYDEAVLTVTSGSKVSVVPK